MPTHQFLHALPRTHRYRALLLDLGGKIISVRAITAGDDAEASGIVRDMLDGHAVELWDGSRFIEQFGPIQT